MRLATISEFSAELGPGPLNPRCSGARAPPTQASFRGRRPLRGAPRLLGGKETFSWFRRLSSRRTVNGVNGGRRTKVAWHGIHV